MLEIDTPKIAFLRIGQDRLRKNIPGVIIQTIAGFLKRKSYQNIFLITENI